MPEGPELYLSALFINRICENLSFSGKIRRNPVHKSADIVWDEPEYTIRAQSRGKELKLNLFAAPQDVTSNKAGKQLELKSTSIHFTFGMSGKFEFTPANELLKHSHLTFFTKNEPKMALSFVDYRRFGRWFQDSSWSADRGPCIIQEYDVFVKYIADNLHNVAFNKPICEVLLNQKFFNGIGNYLRAEILYRCEIPPFQQAKSVLKLQENGTEIKQEYKDTGVTIKKELEEMSVKQQNTSGQDTQKASKRKGQNGKCDESSDCKYLKVEKVEVEETKGMMNGDAAESFLATHFDSKAQQVLQLCHKVPLEVVELGSKKDSLSEMYSDESDSSYRNWLQCYYQPGMKNLADHNKRTIWFSGPPGPMVPKEQKSRKPKTKKSSSDSNAKKEKTRDDEDTGGAEKKEGRLTRRQLSSSSKLGKKSSKAQKVSAKKKEKSSETARQKAAKKSTVGAQSNSNLTLVENKKQKQSKDGSRITRSSLKGKVK
ncbi:endonuclease 8-like 1 [Aplysia californica]|uniref:DNA-(apurinic or apyrimidinic site) lyase n=1 Tax=Aplysia californica TaxID=6500 RepID=A0ABM0K4Q9_APLCA|nr:endonuclease 8-like 1 [Aplysia californica]